MTKSQNPPAFPVPSVDNPLWSCTPGMTMRDYVAVHVLAGICASGPGHHLSKAQLVKEAYDFAEVFLIEREYREDK